MLVNNTETHRHGPSRRQTNRQAGIRHDHSRRPHIEMCVTSVTDLRLFELAVVQTLDGHRRLQRLAVAVIRLPAHRKRDLRTYTGLSRPILRLPIEQTDVEPSCPLVDGSRGQSAYCPRLTHLQRCRPYRADRPAHPASPPARRPQPPSCTRPRKLLDSQAYAPPAHPPVAEPDRIVIRHHDCG